MRLIQNTSYWNDSRFNYIFVCGWCHKGGKVYKVLSLKSRQAYNEIYVLNYLSSPVKIVHADVFTHIINCFCHSLNIIPMYVYGRILILTIFFWNGIVWQKI